MGRWYAYGVASALRCRTVLGTNTTHTHLHSSFSTHCTGNEQIFLQRYEKKKKGKWKKEKKHENLCIFSF